MRRPLAGSSHSVGSAACSCSDAARARLPSTSKEPPCRAHALADRLEAIRVVAHRRGVYRRGSGRLPISAASRPYAGQAMETSLLETVLGRGRRRSPRPGRDRRGARDLAADRRPGAQDDGTMTGEAIAQMEGAAVRIRLGTAALGRFANPAAAIGAWLTLAAWTGPGGARRRRVRLLPPGRAGRRDARGAARPPRAGAARRAVDQLRARDHASISTTTDSRSSGSTAARSCRRPASSRFADDGRSDPPARSRRTPPSCDAIIASLPDWFGLQEGIDECAEAVRTQPGLVCERDGRVVGFLTVVRPSRSRRRSPGWPCMPTTAGDGVGTKTGRGTRRGSLGDRRSPPAGQDAVGSRGPRPRIRAPLARSTSRGGSHLRPNWTCSVRRTRSS